MTPAHHDPVAKMLADQKKEIEQLQQRLADSQEAATLLATEQDALQNYLALRQEEQLAEAAAVMSDVGLDKYQASEFDLARQLFQHALRLHSQSLDTYWYLADTLRILATTPEQPYVSEAVLREGIAIWNRGYQQSPPGADDSWAYVVRAQLAELEALLEAAPNRHYWAAVCYAERAIMLFAEDYYRWAMLARYYRYLALDQTALEATERALQYNASEPLVLAEQAGILINLGRVNEARKSLDKLLRNKTLDPQARNTYKSWKALIYYYQRQFDKAIRLMKSVLRANPQDLWAHGVFADSLRLAGREPEATAAYAQIWAQRENPNYAQLQLNFAEAAFYLGQYDQAIQLHQELLQSRSDLFYAHLGLCQGYLAKANFAAAEKHFVAAVAQAQDEGKLMYAGIMFSTLAALSKKHRWPQAAAALRRLQGKNGFEARLKVAQAQLSQKEFSALNELQAVLQSPPPEGEWMLPAVLAGLGRLHAEAQQGAEAMEMYLRLNAYPTQFPEALTQYLTPYLQPANSPQRTPMVTPIVVELSASLTPANDEAWEEWPVFKRYIPALRDRMKQQFGMAIPGVRLRGDGGSLPQGSYVVSLDEVPLRLGTWESKMVCVLASAKRLQTLGLPATDFYSIPFPLAGQTACWVAPTHAPLLDEHEIETLEDPLEFMICHLEEIIQDNLVSFLDNQEVWYLVESWRQEPGGDTLVKAVLQEDAQGLRLARVLRALVSEKVSLTPWRDILTALQETGLRHDDVQADVVAARLAIKRHLPGNQSGTTRLTLPAAMEDTLKTSLQTQDGKRFLALAPETTQDLLAQMREHLSAMPAAAALIVQSVTLRPFVRRLIELEFPALAVLAQSEVVEFPPETES